MRSATLEGIGSAIKSGLLAADSVVAASQQGGQAEQLYLPLIGELVSKFGDLYPFAANVRKEASKGGQCLSDAYKRLMEENVSLA